MSALADGFALAAARLRRPSSFVALVAALAFVALDAALERRAPGGAAAANTLVGAVFGIALPLVAYLASDRACDGARLDDSVAGLARYGADRRAAGLGVLIGIACVTVVTGVGLALAGALLTHAGQLATTTGIGALGGATYAAWFGAASTVGRRGQGRFWALAADWLLGSATTALALPLPRGHLRNLLGAEPVLAMPQWSASLALGVLALLLTAVALARTPR